MSEKNHPANRKEFETIVATYLETLGIPFQNLSHYLLAFVHRSAVNELPERFPEHNERLEFLGDAVLELIITDRLFHDFPTEPEGRLTDVRSALVRGTNLGAIAERLEFPELLVMSKGELATGGKKNPVILADTFEAFLGAIYLDLGYDTAREFVLRELYPTVENILNKGLYIDPKSHLQELTQRAFGAPPRYDVLSEAGADHDKTYTIGAHVGDILIGLGTGSSKKKAQQDAAEAAIDRKHEWMTRKKPDKTAE